MPDSMALSNWFTPRASACYSSQESMPTTKLSQDEARLLYEECVGAAAAQYDPAKSSLTQSLARRSNYIVPIILGVAFVLATVATLIALVVIKQTPNGNPVVCIGVIVLQIGLGYAGIHIGIRHRR